MIDPHVNAQAENVRVKFITLQAGNGMNDKIAVGSAGPDRAGADHLSKAHANLPDLLPGFNPGVGPLKVDESNRGKILLQLSLVNRPAGIILGGNHTRHAQYTEDTEKRIKGGQTAFRPIHTITPALSLILAAVPEFTKEPPCFTTHFKTAPGKTSSFYYNTFPGKGKA
jgi:hypothetical protein